MVPIVYFTKFWLIIYKKNVTRGDLYSEFGLENT